jgi:hypothetical protein
MDTKNPGERDSAGFFVKGDGGAGRNRTDDRGFAVLGLTTWRPRHLKSIREKRSRKHTRSSEFCPERSLSRFALSTWDIFQLLDANLTSPSVLELCPDRHKEAPATPPIHSKVNRVSSFQTWLNCSRRSKICLIRKSGRK